MFGIAVARLDQVSDEEKERYQALYCGLCRSIKRRYGQVSRAALSYDLAFLTMFLDSLIEPPETCGSEHCISHPKKRMPYCESAYSDYAADLSIALAYHKCLDDIADEGTTKAHAAELALRKQYAKAHQRIPNECVAIERSMQQIRDLESTPDTSPDSCGRVFGQLMGELFGSGCLWPVENMGSPGIHPSLSNEDLAEGAEESGTPSPAPQAGTLEGRVWARAAGEFGALLGRLIYMMDAAVDYESDKESGSYNPFVRIGATPQQMREVLAVLAEAATDAFERLPLVQDVHLMRSVLYAGVWQKFNHTYKDLFDQEHTEDSHAKGSPLI